MYSIGGTELVSVGDSVTVCVAVNRAEVVGKMM
jgi:hypothetical protein